MIEFIKEQTPHFDIIGACYPEGHPDSPNQISDIQNLKKKVDAGCSSLVTQLFFDNERFYDFQDKCILADSGYQGLMKIYPQVQTPRKSSKLKPLTAEDKACNHALSKERSKVENIFAKVKTFKMFSTTYRNHRKRFGLRMNLIAGIINHELGF
ncbi:transposase-like protein%2C IS1381 ISSpn7 [Streptococcus pneumoniae]|nr:transposase-like protein%2C IS1381 ISSpn7 [Streptococcus pneumoniae]